MDIWILFVLAVVLLFLILHLIPLGLTVKGKIVTSMFSGLVAILVFLTKEVIPIWQLIIVFLLSIFIVSYFLEKKWYATLFKQQANQQPVFAIAEVQQVKTSAGEDGFSREDQLNIERESISEISLEELAPVPEIREPIVVDENMMEDLEELLNRHVQEVVDEDERKLSYATMEEIVSPVNELFEEEEKKKERV